MKFASSISSKFVTVLEISRKEAKTAEGGSGFIYRKK
jgi:hypothetical protein